MVAENVKYNNIINACYEILMVIYILPGQVFGSKKTISLPTKLLVNIALNVNLKVYSLRISVCCVFNFT